MLSRLLSAPSGSPCRQSCQHGAPSLAATTLHPHDWMGGARRGARLYFRCRARTVPFTSAASKPRAPFAPLTSHTTSCASVTAQHAAAAHPATSATSVAARATSLP